MVSTVEEASFEGNAVDVTSNDAQDSTDSLRLCITCAKEIPANRLAAQPFATRCVPCLEASGDVKPLRRLDETIGEETVSTYFKDNSRIDRYIGRMYTHVPSSRSLAEATDAPVVEMKKPEREMERRAGDTLTQLIANQSETEEINEGN